MKLAGKIAIVTGASRGIGKAIATDFAKEGAGVVICSRNEPELLQTTNELQKISKKIYAIKADVSTLKGVEIVMQATLSEFDAIDILINNAGVGHLKSVAEMTLEEWNQVFAANLGSAFLCSKAVLPSMMNKKQGHIVNISSLAGLKAAPFSSAYGASKAGMIALTQSLATEVGKFGIYVNAICPGAVETQMLEENFAQLTEYLGFESPDALRQQMLSGASLGRLATASEVAKTALFLVSGNGSGITGATIPVTAGQAAF